MKHIKHHLVAPFDFQGLAIREITPDEFKHGSIATIEVPPNVKHSRAKSTRSDKIYICMEGTIAFKIEGKDLEMRQSEIIYIPKNEWFQYENKSSTTAKLILIHTPSFDLKCEEFADEE